MDGKQLLTMARDTFGLEDTDAVSAKQLDYVLTMSKPVNYLLKNHKIGGKPVTYSIPNYDISKSRQHRPWQIDILNDMSKDVSVIKSRQLGLN